MKPSSGWTLTQKLSQVQNISLAYLNMEFSSSLFCVSRSENGEWAIVHRPARKVINTRYSPDDLEYQEIMFNLVIQRKPLFYIINVILPCSLISSLVVLAYFLPAQGRNNRWPAYKMVLLSKTEEKWCLQRQGKWYKEEPFDRGGRDEGSLFSCSVHP